PLLLPLLNTTHFFSDTIPISTACDFRLGLTAIILFAKEHVRHSVNLTILFFKPFKVSDLMPLKVNIKGVFQKKTWARLNKKPVFGFPAFIISGFSLRIIRNTVNKPFKSLLKDISRAKGTLI